MAAAAACPATDETDEIGAPLQENERTVAMMFLLLNDRFEKIGVERFIEELEETGRKYGWEADDIRRFYTRFSMATGRATSS